MCHHVCIEMPKRTPHFREDEDRVPVFGTWPRIYAAIVVCALAVMALLIVFSRWPY